MRYPNYQCIRCGYASKYKTDMMRHFQRKNGCPSILNDVEITDEIKEQIYKNRYVKLDQIVCRPQVQKEKEKKNTERHTDEDTCLIRKVEAQFQYQLSLVKRKKPELLFQRLLEIELKAYHKVYLSGESDLTNDNMHGEIKKCNDWKCALGQLIAYNVEEPKKELNAYFFGKFFSPNAKNAALKTFTTMGINMYYVDINDNAELSITNMRTNEIGLRKQIGHLYNTNLSNIFSNP